MDERLVCAWCEASIPATARRDSKFCGKRCRQASWRFRVERSGLEAGATDRPMRFAYADPPYPGKAFYYPENAEVDHASLVDRLCREFPDGWALSTSSGALRDVLLLCPPDVRVCAWFKGPRPTRSRRAVMAWEPLIVHRGRPLSTTVVQDLRDALVAQGRFRAYPGAMIGMKPPSFAEWMFRQLGATIGDELVDLYPGSGAIRRAWIRFTFQAAASDVSFTAAADASDLANDDTSLADPSFRDLASRPAAARRDGSQQYSGDASLPPGCDPSSLQGIDASSVAAVDRDASLATSGATHA